jgi:hypothetical protein
MASRPLRSASTVVLARWREHGAPDQPVLYGSTDGLRARHDHAAGSRVSRIQKVTTQRDEGTRDDGEPFPRGGGGLVGAAVCWRSGVADKVAVEPPGQGLADAAYGAGMVLGGTPGPLGPARRHPRARPATAWPDGRGGLPVKG